MGEGDGRCERCGSDGEAKEAMEAMGSGRVAPTGPLTPFGESFSKGGGGREGKRSGPGNRYGKAIFSARASFAKHFRGRSNGQKRFPAAGTVSSRKGKRFAIPNRATVSVRFQALRPQGERQGGLGGRLSRLSPFLSLSLTHSLNSMHARTHTRNHPIIKKKMPPVGVQIFNIQPAAKR
jgi:hypothetical protein